MQRAGREGFFALVHRRLAGLARAVAPTARGRPLPADVPAQSRIQGCGGCCRFDSGEAGGISRIRTPRQGVALFHAVKAREGAVRIGIPVHIDGAAWRTPGAPRSCPLQPTPQEPGPVGGAGAAFRVFGPGRARAGVHFGRCGPRRSGCGLSAGDVCPGLWAAPNRVCHALHKPTELLAPVSGALAKTPSETWRVYGPHFREHATAVIAPELLAAPPRVESAANPLAQTCWRWRLTWHPFELYGPASGAVGIHQIIDGTFAQARRDCLNEPIVAGGDSTRAPGFCRFDGLYSRVVPDRAVEPTATLLDRAVAATPKRQRIATARLRQ